MIRYWAYLAWELFKLLVTVAVGLFVIWFVMGCTARPEFKPPPPCHIVLSDDQGHVDCVDRGLGWERWKQRNGYGD